MTDRLRLPLAALVLALSTAGVAHAQLRLGNNSGAVAAPPASSTAGPARTADFIVALVNADPITNHEVRDRVGRIEQQLAQRGGPRPSREEIAREVLEGLIAEKAQLQLATELGLRVTDAEVDQAEQAVAAQNQLSVAEFRRRLAAEGVIDLNRLRAELRSQLLLQKVREREVDARVRVTEADIDDYLREQQSQAADPAQLELNLAHVLVAVPEGATEARVAELQARAQRVLERARAGDDFGALAREFSDAPERVQGGVFGLRPATRLPDLFVNATRALPVGGVAGVLRSAAGFHVLKVVDKRQPGVATSVTQTRARHILLRPTAGLTQAQAVERLAAFRQQILAGQASFEALAREHSADGSAAGGGDLGWAGPGQFVPEFEQAMDALKPGDVSAPVVSRFGVHLIRVDERRQTALSAREQRDAVRGAVREKKLDEALDLWLRDLRARAYVELREPPQL